MVRAFTSDTKRNVAKRLNRVSVESAPTLCAARKVYNWLNNTSLIIGI